MIDSTVRLVGTLQSVTLTDTVSGLLRQPKGGGWGMAPVANSWFEGAGDGARLRGTRRTIRELTIPIRAFGSNRADIEATLRMLAQSIHDPFRVYVDFANGSSYYIDAVYESGMEGLYGDDPEQFADAPLVLHCPDPYWTSVYSQSFIVAPVPADAPFLPEYAGLHVGSAVALGEITVSNIGDVASIPSWTIHGPGTGLTISLDGRGFLLNRNIPSNETIHVKFEDGGWTIKNHLGVNLYGQLDPAPYFIQFPPGTSIVDVYMGTTGPESYVQVIYPERREVVY